MGEPFLWVHANPRQECLGRFTQLFDTGGGAWGPGTAGGTFRLFCRRMEIGERPISPRFRMLEEAVTQALRRGTRETVGSLQPVRGSTSRHPAQLSSLRKGARARTSPNRGVSSFSDGAMTALGGKIRTDVLVIA